MKYDCDLIKDLLPLYHDGVTNQFSSKVVEEHLKECDECRGYYNEVKKAINIQCKSPSEKDHADGYLSLAKRLRRVKWYWRICMGLFIGCIISLSLMYAEGYRFNPMSAVYAGNIVNKSSRLLATVPMGKERILYIYDDDGIYREINVTYQFPFWKYSCKWPNKCIADSNSGVQLITSSSYANSIDKSLYIIISFLP